MPIAAVASTTNRAAPIERTRPRTIIKGELPSPLNPPSGCVFHTRCFKAQDLCRVETPELRELEPGHTVACHFPVLEPLGSAPIVGPDPGAADWAGTGNPTGEANGDHDAVRQLGADYDVGPGTQMDPSSDLWR